MESLAAAYRRFLVRWVDGVRRGALAVVLGSVALTVAALWFVATNIGINTDTDDMLSPELEFRKDSAAVSEAFPQFSDNIVVVVDGVTPDLADDATLRLVEALRARPELFGEVWDLAGDPFLRRNGLLYKDVDELAGLADRLAEAQPFLGALWSDPSLRGLVEMLSLAIDEMLKGDDLPIEIDGVLTRIAEVAEAQARGEFRPLSWWRLMEGEGAAPETGRRIFLIQPVLDYGSLQPADDAMDGLRALVAEMGLVPEHGVRVRLTGSAALSQEELASVEEGMGLAGVLSLTLVVGLLFFGLRSGRLAAATLLTLVMGLTWTAGFATLAVGELNLISVAFAVLFIGLSVDFGIHFGLRYREGIDGGGSHEEALRKAAEGVGGALTLCAVSAAIAFYSFLPTAYLGLAELGLIAGSGMFIALLANVTTLPALLTLMPPRPHAPSESREALPASAALKRHARPVVWGALALGIGAAALLPQARFDFDPLNLKDPDTESVGTLFDLMEDRDTAPYAITILAGDLEQARDLAARLDGLAEVDDARTLADFVPSDQEEKLEILFDTALFLMPALTAEERAAAPTNADRAAAVKALAERLGRLSSGTEADAARRLSAALSAVGEAGLAELETRLLAALPGRLAALKTSLEAGPVVLEDLPEGLRAREVAADGRAKVRVLPRDDLRDRDALERFVTAVRAVAPKATGSPVVIMEAGNAVLAAFQQAAVLAIGLIGLMLAVLLRSLREVLLVFAPLVLAALLTVAASVLFSLPFNFANVIVLPLLFGLGVAGGIHLVVRERATQAGAGVMETSTPRAVVFSALTTIGSFGSIALSSHPGTASMGILLTIAITLTLLCTLVVLPALMKVLPPVGKGAA